MANIIDSDIDHEQYMKSYPPIFYIKPVDLKTVAEAVCDLRSSTSCGVDGLTSRLLKQWGPSVFKPLQHVINLSIESNIFPEAWKTGCITPLYKEGDATDARNYRPISILPCFRKIIERIVHTQI